MAASSNQNQLSPEQLEALINDVLDWQYMHGSVLKVPPATGEIFSRPIGVTLRPTSFPKKFYEESLFLQLGFNKLYCAVANDDKWLEITLCNLFASNPLAQILWKIHNRVKEEGYVQGLALGIFRSDYMSHVPSNQDDRPSELQLKQVEFNTYSVAGGVHSARISKMHRRLSNRAAYGSFDPNTSSVLPNNQTTESLASGLTLAHRSYGPPKSGIDSKTGILFIVQPNNINICDERPIEELLWDKNIPTYRIEFGQAVLDSTSLSPSRELLFHPDFIPSLSRERPLEVSVVYLRAGYDENEYTPAGIAARLLLECSRAIKCPSVLTHLATFKKIQQELSVPGALSRFLPQQDEAAKVASTFMPMYPLDATSELGRRGREIALNPSTAANHVLKPSLEGGGHNIYGAAISEFLHLLPEDKWDGYVLMELIESPVDIENSLITSSQEFYSGPVVSELGIFGVCLFSHADVENGGKFEIFENREAGFSFKTKARDVEEMSVVKGFGCFDSPYLM